mgnify:CR=1 FL=1
MLELARLMSPEQFEGMQTLLNDLTTVSNELASFTDQKSFLDAAIEEVSTFENEWKNLD